MQKVGADVRGGGSVIWEFALMLVKINSVLCRSSTGTVSYKITLNYLHEKVRIWSRVTFDPISVPSAQKGFLKVVVFRPFLTG